MKEKVGHDMQRCEIVVLETFQPTEPSSHCKETDETGSG